MTLKGTTYFECFQEVRPQLNQSLLRAVPGCSMCAASQQVTEQLKQCLASEPNLKPEKVAFLTGFIQARSTPFRPFPQYSQYLWC